MIKSTLIKDKIKSLTYIWVLASLISFLALIFFINYLKDEAKTAIIIESEVKKTSNFLKESIYKNYSTLIYATLLTQQNQQKLLKIEDITIDIEKINEKSQFLLNYINKNKKNELKSDILLVKNITNNFMTNSILILSDANIKPYKISKAKKEKELAISKINYIIKNLEKDLGKKIHRIEFYSLFIQTLLFIVYILTMLIFFHIEKSIYLTIYKSIDDLKNTITSILSFLHGKNSTITTINSKETDELSNLTNLLNDSAYLIEKYFNSEKKLKNNFEKQLNEKINEVGLYNIGFNEIAMISKTDKKGNITYVNELFCKTMGYTKSQLLGQPYSVLSSIETKKTLYDELWQTITSGEKWTGMIANKKSNDEIVYCQSVIVPVFDKNNQIVEYFSVKIDITKTRELTEEIIKTQKDLIFAMGEIAESRSKETGNHVKRVAEYSRLMAKLYGLSDIDCETLYTASPMHDIGKVAIPDAILNKPGKLTDKEREIMETHAQKGYEMLKNSNREILRAAAIVSYGHHEKWDGTGYPNGFKKEQIHIFARITAVCDVFDALGSDRCYKKAWELDKIINLLIKEKNKHFDPKLVDILINNLESFLSIKDYYKDNFNSNFELFK